MQSTQHSPDQTTARRFRAPTIEAALELARRELGPDIEVVEANRIRRGGVGGFFATELGVEIVVDASSPATTTFTGATVGKPHFYDRVVEEERPPTANGLDRLIEDVTRAERAAYQEAHDEADDDVPGEPAGASTNTDSFADHFARELAVGAAGAVRPGADPTAEMLAAALAGMREPAVQMPASLTGAVLPELDELPELPRAKRARRRATPRPDQERLGPEQPDRPADRADRTDRADGNAARPRVKRDPLRRPSELAAAAASRLIADLADVVARDGSRVDDLSRLRVSITTPDGSVIELTAEMDGRDR